MSRCRSRSVWRSNLLFWLLLILLLLCTSCTLIQLPVFPEPAEHTQAFAEQLFINGDFENALLEYEQIYETALSPEDRNHALYGLACTQLMLARTEAQVVEAIGNLQKWDANKGTAPFGENRHLLILALKQQSELLQNRNKEQIDHENKQNSLIANQQLQISQMTSIIEKLKNQIEELEAIDKNVQEKRKPL